MVKLGRYFYVEKTRYKSWSILAETFTCTIMAEAQRILPGLHSVGFLWFEPD
jgi:hypothetical protein